MDQGISITPSAHVLRLVLMLFGAVLGLLVLSFVFGSSSASADDGGDSGDSIGSALGGVVAEVAKPVHTVTQSATHTVAAVAEKAPATSILAPVAPVLTPIAGVVDQGLRDLGTAIGPVAGAVAIGVDTASAVATPATTSIALRVVAISGIAHGALNLPGVVSGGSDPAVSGTASAGSGVLAAAIAGALFVLLAVRRQTPTTPAMPGSPVYATDSSPD